MTAGFAAGFTVTVKRTFALIGKPFRQTAPQLENWILRIIHVITAGFTGQQHMQCMVYIIIPLRNIRTRFVSSVARKIMRRIMVVFQNQMNMTLIGESRPHPVRQLGQDIWLGIVHNGVNCIQTQAVNMVFLQPV